MRFFKFHFEKTKDGFIVTNEVSKRTIKVYLRCYKVRITAPSKDSYTGYNISDYRGIQRHCIYQLVPCENPENKKPIPRRLCKWALEKALICIRKRFAAYWHECIKSRLSQDFIQLNKKICSVIGPKIYHPSSCYTQILSKPYLLKDMLNYNAAIYTLQYCMDRAIDIPESWMDLYTLEGSPNTSLRKTLMSMPRQMPRCIVEAIRLTSVKTPWYGKAKILFMTSIPLYPTLNERIFQTCTQKEIIEVGKKARSKGLMLRMRKTTHVNDMYRYLIDYPHKYGGNLMGLFNRSYKWHQDCSICSKPRYDPATAFPTPNWGSLDIKGVKYISSIQDLYEEGRTMHHCVDSYDRRCIEGDSFIYSVKKGKQRSTIEVNSQGQVIQAYGPSNTKNRACVWGTRSLQKAIKCKLN